MRIRFAAAMLALLFPPTLMAATIQLAETGQTGCWNTAGAPVLCTDPAGVGQDGAEKSGAAWPSPRFVDNGNGTITDTLTALTWLKNANCFGARTWTNAISAVGSLAAGSCGLTDGSTAGEWRLPNINEQESLVNRQEANNASWLGNQGFTGVSGGSYYWSGSTYATDPAKAWTFTASGIEIYNGKTSSFYTWPVRGGQGGNSVVSLPKTGQTGCWDGSGAPLASCAGSGQDGESQAGTAWPAPRFVDNGNGTVSDNLTGLVWLKNANCSDTVGGIAKNGGYLTWENAVAWSNSLASGSCGLTDGSAAGAWRLPNAREMRSIINRQQGNSATWLNSQGLANVLGSFYWTSSSAGEAPANVWTVNLNLGYMGTSNKTGGIYAWPVRGGQTSTLKVSKAGGGSGSVTPNIGSLTWNGATGTANYAEDAVVVLTAAPAANSVFSGWSGGGCSGGGSCQVTLGANVTVTATFLSDGDGDGIADGNDNCPTVHNANQLDTDGDGAGNVCDPDDDNDMVLDVSDNCPLLVNADQFDTDQDGMGDVCDPDDDNDGVADSADAAPLNPLVCSDNDADTCDDCSGGVYSLSNDGVNSDADGICDQGDPDDDNDAIADAADNCPLAANADQLDTDLDGAGNVCDPDDDNDAIFDTDDAFPLDPTETVDTDHDGIGNNGDNCPSVANPAQADANSNGIGDACDNADTDGDGFSDAREVAAGTDPSSSASRPYPSVTITPSTIDADEQTTVTLQIVNVSLGGTINVLQDIDGNQDGIIGENEMTDVRIFSVTDGVSSNNPMVPGDDDGTANGEITTTLPYDAPNDVHHAIGHYLFWPTENGGGSVSLPFIVNAFPAAQSISGMVTDGTNPLPGMVVSLAAPGVVVRAVTDALGQFTLPVAMPGSYRLNAEDYSGQYLTTGTAWNEVVTVGASQQVTGIVRTLTGGINVVTGVVTLPDNVTPVPGVEVDAECAGGKYTKALTWTNGNYLLNVPAENCQVFVRPTDHIGLNPSSKGLVGYEELKISVDATGGDVNGINFTLEPTAMLISGTVRDESGTPLRGLHVDAVNWNDAGMPVAMAMTGNDGTYALGVNGSHTWNLSILGDSIWPLGLLSNHIDNLNVNTDTLTNRDLTIYTATAWIEGTVRDASDQPLAGIEVRGWTNDGTLRTGGNTGTDGSYRMPARGGLVWNVDAMTGEGGTPAVEAPSQGQTVTVDFIAGQQACAAPSSITVPAIDYDGAYRITWGASSTFKPAYVLEESTSSDFTTGVQTIYTGLGRVFDVSGRSLATRYYYRVKTIRNGYVDSGWTVAVTPVANACAQPGAITAPGIDGDGSYTVSWVASATPGVTYTLHEATTPDFSIGLRQAYSGPATSVNITGRTTDQTYYYRVRASIGTTDFRSTWAIRANGCAVPGGGTAAAPGAMVVPASDPDGSYTVSWAPSATAGAGYAVQEAENATFSVKQKTFYVGTATSYNAAGRLPGKTYYYRVKAVKDGWRDSAFSTGTNSCAVIAP